MTGTVLVTGTNRGLGLEFVRQYAQTGWRVLACCRAPARAPALTAIAAGSGGRVSIHTLDVTDFAAVEVLARELDGTPIDLLVNNAAIYGPDAQDLPDIDLDGWAGTFKMNAIAPLKVALAFLPHIMAGRGRRIVSLTSRMGSIADNTSGGDYAYRSSKAALNAAMRSLAIDLKGRGVMVAVLHPGWVRTDMGGTSAPLTTAQSIRGLRAVIEGLTLAGSGGFFNHDGTALPW